MKSSPLLKRLWKIDFSAWWIFPAFLTLALNFLIFLPSWITFVCFLLVCFRIMAARQRRLLALCLIIGLVMGLYFAVLAQKSSKQKWFIGPLAGELLVMPDQIKVNGDLLQVTGFLTDDGAEHKVQASYQLQSQEEKERWSQLTDTVVVYFAGICEEPEGVRNLNGFDYRTYLQRSGVDYLLKIEEIEQIQRTHDWRLTLNQLRRKLLVQCQKLPPTMATYAKALLFGFKDSEFGELGDSLARLGILHFFSLSGLHVLFFLGLFRYVLLRVGVTVERVWFLQLIFSCLCAGLAGYSISIIRTLLQRNLADSNRHFAGKLSKLDCLALTLLICLIFQPYALLSAGGQLSFGLAFLILFAAPLAQRYRYASLCFSLLLSIGILPLLWYHFYEWQPLSVLLSVWLAPLFTYVLLPLLVLCFGLSYFLPTGLFSIVEHVFVLFSEGLTSLRSLDYLRIVVGKPMVLQVLFGIGLVLCLLHFLKQQQAGRIVWCILGLVLIAGGKYCDPSGILSFVDVGQGDSIFLMEPFHQATYLIDTGGRLNFAQEPWQIGSWHSNAEQTLIPFLKSQGVRTLDHVFLTHGDADHMGDVAELQRAIPIRTLYFPRGMEQKDSAGKTLKWLAGQGVRLVPVLTDTELDLPFQVLHPWVAGSGENDDSLVLALRLKVQTILLTGDLEQAGEARLMARYPSLKADILKAGHHGSRTSTAPEFIQQLAPRDVVLSCGRHNRFGHPHAETLATLEDRQILRTDQQGMIYYTWWSFGKRLAPAQWVKSD